MLVHSCPILGGFACLSGSDASESITRSRLASNAEAGMSVIFVGHGSDRALLTAPALGRYPERYRHGHAELLSRETLRPAEHGYFAYACNAAKELGGEVQARGGLFIGYSGEIPFVRTEDGGAIHRVFGYPMEIVAAAIVAGELSLETAGAVRAFYQESSSVERSDLDDFKRILRLALNLHELFFETRGS